MPKSREQMQEIAKYFKCGASVTVTAQSNGFVVSQESFQRSATNAFDHAESKPEFFICKDINEVIQRLAAMLTYEAEIAEVQQEKEMKEKVESLTDEVGKLTRIVESHQQNNIQLKSNDASPSES